MVFALATDDGSLMAFPAEEAATAHCEGIDVEDGLWLFFAEDGAALEPQFTHPNKRGTFTVVSGAYILRQPQSSSLPSLKIQLPRVKSVQGMGLNTVAEVERLISKGNHE